MYLLNSFLESGQLPEEPVLDNIIPASEQTILSTLDTAPIQMHEMDFTVPITIEIGAPERPIQDRSVILSMLCSQLESLS